MIHVSVPQDRSGAGKARVPHRHAWSQAVWTMAMALVAGLAPDALGYIKMPSIFGDNMVLQQGIKVPIWGWADEGEEVSVQFGSQRITTRAKDGRFRVVLNPLTASSEPAMLSISGKNRIQFQNVLVGEVWVCSGQSNMALKLMEAFEPQADINGSANPGIRLFTVTAAKADEPADDTRSQWLECRPVNTTWFSAVGFYFGRELQKALNVPVGLIHTSVGGSPAEAWMSRSALTAKPDYMISILDFYDTASKKYTDARAKFDKEVSDAKKAGNQPPSEAPKPPDWKPASLYNGMVAPILQYAIKGVIWYQGEANRERAYQYRTLFPDLIKNWRKDWGQGDFPFLCVQLAPYDEKRNRTITEITAKPVDSKIAELREAQLIATKSPMQKVGVVVITDIGEKDDIHPTRKAPVGARLALAARAIAYGEKIVYSGPVYKAMRVKTDKVLGDRAIISFDHVGGGLEARGGDLKGFAICGADRNFVWAKAEVLPDNTVAVSHPDVKKPVAVRYGWADFPVVNLWNKDGLPASPFRTDDFPMITAPK